MEDRYLFKAKRIDNGEWVVGYIARYGHTGKEKYYIIPSYASVLYSFLQSPLYTLYPDENHPTPFPAIHIKFYPVLDMP